MEARRLREFKRKVAAMCETYGVQIAVSDSDYGHLVIIDRLTPQDLEDTSEKNDGELMTA